MGPSPSLGPCALRTPAALAGLQKREVLPLLPAFFGAAAFFSKKKASGYKPWAARASSNIQGKAAVLGAPLHTPCCTPSLPCLLSQSCFCTTLCRWSMLLCCSHAVSFHEFITRSLCINQQLPSCLPYPAFACRAYLAGLAELLP